MKITLLTEDQIWGSHALDVIKKYGTKVSMTDLAYVLSNYDIPNTSETAPDGGRACMAWTASRDSYGVCVEKTDGLPSSSND